MTFTTTSEYVDQCGNEARDVCAQAAIDRMLIQFVRWNCTSESTRADFICTDSYLPLLVQFVQVILRVIGKTLFALIHAAGRQQNETQVERFDRHAIARRGVYIAPYLLAHLSILN